jgi:hypothetical protein
MDERVKSPAEAPDVNRPQIPALHQPPLMLGSRRAITQSFSKIDSQK